MPLLRGIGERLEEVRIAVSSAAVLRRTGSRSVEAHCFWSTPLKPHAILDDDVVVPAVAEIVDVLGSAAFLQHVAEAVVEFVQWWPVLEPCILLAAREMTFAFFAIVAS
jgi:hypothetical protein